MLGLMNNQDRASRADLALKAYLMTEKLDLESHIQDMICDALHLAKSHGLDPKQVTELAVASYLCETEDDPDGWLTSWKVTLDAELTRDDRDQKDEEHVDGT